MTLISLNELKRINVLLCCYLIVLFAIFFSINSQYIGPAYLSDEIGYLTKAAALAAHSVDHATSWHGGYSVFLSPFFFVELNPFFLWKMVLILNALFFSFSFFILYLAFQNIFPSVKKVKIFFAVIVCSIYPSWIAISGYAFPSSAFIFLLSLSLYFFSKINDKNPSIYLYFLFSVCTGYLYWLHPLGLPIAALSIFIVSLVSLQNKKWIFLFFHIFVIFLMISAYKFLIHSWLLEIMSQEEYEIRTHYRSMQNIIDGMLSKSFISNFIIIFCSKLAYLLISTFGIYIYSFSFLIERFNKRSSIDRTFFFLLFVVLAPITIIGVSSIVFAVKATGSPLRVDHWIYGRYAEMALLPALLLGFLAPWSFRFTLLSISFVVITGTILQSFVNDSNLENFNNLVNIQGFWPLIFGEEVGFSRWFYIGAAGILIAFLLSKRFCLLMLVPIYILIGISNTNFHRNILNAYSNPSPVINIILNHYPADTCIGFDDRFIEGTTRERKNLYSYYLYKYDFRRMSVNKWLETCDGPFLTFDAKPFIQSEEVKIIAKVHYSSLFLVVKNKDLYLYENETVNYKDIDFDITGLNQCQFNGCFMHTAADAKQFSQTGIYKDQSLRTNQRQGFLFYGPYKSIKANTYFINLQLGDNFSGAASFDIVTRGHKILAKNLHEYEQHSDGSYTFKFILEEDVYDLEVRLSVSKFTELEFRNYRIGLFNNEINESPQRVLNFTNISSDTEIKIENFFYYTFSQVGAPVNGALISTGKKGYLLYGPYQNMKAGKYTFMLRGTVLVNNNAWVDIVSNQGNQSHARFTLETMPRDTDIVLESTVNFDTDVDDLEIRVFVSAEDEVTISNLELKKLDI